ncbi:MAG TPA: putative urea ABC transporter substrate-binding protein [Pseudomonadales bacterium]|nr:putative urea ABC transporter substrate-binding protein [Pseudomonadales bacterium]
MRITHTLLTLLLLCGLAVPAAAADKPKFTLAWSIYVGWMPWEYADAKGILDRWADRYGIEIEVVQVNDYIESVNQYTAGQFDAVTATNMDILTIAGASGVDTTALIVGDFSNGNDAVVLRDVDDLAAIRGKRVHLVELSVSHYLLARALDSVGLTERDITLVNTSDADMVSAWAATGVPAVVTWNPMLSEIRRMPSAKAVFDSTQIPGEILDLTVVNTETLAAHPEFGKALVGAWYETVALLGDPQHSEAAQRHMAAASGTDLAGFRGQLETTHLFSRPEEGVAFVTSDAPRQTMEHVAEFSYARGLLGPMAPNPGWVGIEFADGSVWGNERNVQLRFTDAFMRQAAADAGP